MLIVSVGSLCPRWRGNARRKLHLMSRQVVTFHGSDRLRGKHERRRAKRDLRRGREPQPRYTTGKFWID